MEPVDPNLEP
uniref:Truncated tat protein n=1 Tax=Human immunodeficiency virus type 1 TaxID=11676 RepID=Q3S5E1_HV1|nr:truncated tat protein [Human immunodeficiency virus 1]